MRNKIFITGATGFLGSNLVRKLHNPKNEITIFVPEKSHHPFLNGLGIKRKYGDIRYYRSLVRAMKGCDYVYHLAALSISDKERKKELFSVNVSGTENVMRACLEVGVKKVVHVSSIAVLGFSTNEKIKLTEKDNMDFKDYIYGQSKKLSEDKVQEYVKKGLNVTIVNPCSVFGAGEIEPLGLVKNIMNGRIKFTYPGGTCFVAVDDVVDGIILAMEKGEKGQRYILSSGYMRFKEMYNKIAHILKKPRIRFELPKITYYPMYLLGAIMQTLFKKPVITTEIVRWSYNYRNCDSSKARKEMEWAPSVTFEQAIRKALGYYKKFGMLEIK